MTGTDARIPEPVVTPLPEAAGGSRGVAPTDPEDTKIVTLARATRARTAAAQGACVRDTDGRTYAAATVALPHLQISALTLAVGMAVSSGATGLEAVAVVAAAAPAAVPTVAEQAAVTDLADHGVGTVLVWLSGPDGQAVGWTPGE
ncbi:MAG: cytidine deaminase [Propionibacteriaceae bacterium]